MKTAMILAAGRGERLKPLTNHIPKALCKINNIPLIEHHVLQLAQAGFERLIINHAHLGGQIRHYLGDGQRFGIKIQYSPEPPGGLETGGGIVNALSLLGDEPFITVNTDIFTDYDFKKLKLPTDHLAHLVLTQKPDYATTGDFGLEAHNRLNNHDKQYTFSGIACYHPQIFYAHPLRRFSLTPLLRELAEQQKVTAELHTGVWFDIGSPQRLKYAQEQAVSGD